MGRKRKENIEMLNDFTSEMMVMAMVVMVVAMLMMIMVLVVAMALYTLALTGHKLSLVS